MLRKIIDRLFSEICLDNRIDNGIFSIENNVHIEVLRDGLRRHGLTLDESILVTNTMLEGRFPERQAYNEQGLLVTFPTSEYKQRAIARGTHFETPPPKPAGNVFTPNSGQGAPQAPQAPPATTPSAPATAAPATAAQAPTPDPTKLQPTNLLPQDRAVQAVPTSPTTAAPATQATQTRSGETELKADTEKPVDQRTPEEKEIDAKAVVQMLSAAPASIDISSRYPQVECKLMPAKFTLIEGKEMNFIQSTDGRWFDAEGNYIGRLNIDEVTNRLVIAI
jgi:hypothetical protein